MLRKDLDKTKAHDTDNEILIKDSFCAFNSRYFENIDKIYTPYEINEDDIHSLTKNNHWRHWPPQQVIRYTFKLPTDKELLKKLNSIKTHDTSYPVKELTLSHQDSIRESFSLWQAASRLTFIEDDNDYHHRIFGFHSKDNIVGYADHGKVPHCNGTIGFSVNRQYDYKVAALHEIGHVAGLYHPFDRPFAVTSRFKKSQGFSIMNYNGYLTELSQSHMIETPMPLDYKAIQTIYGEPPAKNNSYHVNDYFNFPNKHAKTRTVMSLPLVKGSHTLSAQSSDLSFTLDLREHGRSACQYGDIYAANDIQNVITGTGAYKIHLNGLDNFVNATDATATTLYIHSKNKSDKYIVGFKPKTDKIMLPCYARFAIQDEMTQCYNNNAPSHQLCHSTAITLNNNQTIHLVNVEKNDIHLQHIMTRCGLPQQLVADFLNNFMQGTAIAFIHSLTDHLLDYYECSITQKTVVTLLLESLYVFFSGNILANLAGTAVSRILLENFEVSPNLANFCGKLTTASISIYRKIQQVDLSTCAEVVTSFAGSIAGSAFSFWCNKNIVNPLKKTLTSPKDMPSNHPPAIDI